MVVNEGIKENIQSIATNSFKNRYGELLIESETSIILTKNIDYQIPNCHSLTKSTLEIS